MTPEERKKGEDVWLRASLMSSHEQQIEIVGDALRAAFNAGMEEAAKICDACTRDDDAWDAALFIRARLSQKEESK